MQKLCPIMFIANIDKCRKKVTFYTIYVNVLTGENNIFVVIRLRSDHICDKCLIIPSDLIPCTTFIEIKLSGINSLVCAFCVASKN